MMIEGSAVAAMAALRTQIEDRLFQTEDYRALKALDRAIADVQTSPKSALSTPVMPSASTLMSASHSEQFGSLQQRIGERFESSAA